MSFFWNLIYLFACSMDVLLFDEFQKLPADKSKFSMFYLISFRLKDKFF